MWKLSLNSIAALLAQVSSALGLLLATPIFLKYLGGEAYGLLGVMATVQAICVLMDLGVSTYLMRETARYKASADKQRYQSTYRLVFIFAILGGAIILALGVASPDFLATEWLRVNELSSKVVSASLLAIFLHLLLKWFCGFLRANALGMQWVVSASMSQITGNLLRYGVGAVLVIWPGMGLETFFWFQVLCTAVELLILLYIARRILPSPIIGPINLSSMTAEIRFAGSLSIALLLWSAACQFDRVMLSRLLSLADFGEFMLGLTISSAVLVLMGPLGAILIPKLSSLAASQKFEELKTTYLVALNITAVMAGAVSVTLFVFMDELFGVWLAADSGRYETIVVTATLYSVGNLAMIVGSLPYYLQVARGNLRYHLMGSTASTVALLPALYILISHYGVEGAGMAWALINVVALGWSAWISTRLIRGLLISNVLKLTAMPIAAMATVTMALDAFISFPGSRIAGLCFLLAIVTVALSAGLLASPMLLGYIKSQWAWKDS